METLERNTALERHDCKRLVLSRKFPISSSNWGVIEECFMFYVRDNIDLRFQ